MILRHRDDFPCREFRAVIHCLSLRHHPPKCRTAIIAREHCSMPAFLLQLIIDAWPELSDTAVTFLPAQDEPGHLHFAVAEGALGLPFLYRVNLAHENEALATFTTACDETDLASPLQLLQRLGIDEFIDSDLDFLEINRSNPGTPTVTIETNSAAIGGRISLHGPVEVQPLRHVISLDDSIGETYNPLGPASTPLSCPGIDFAEVFHLCDWLNTALTTPNWLLPDDANWHVASTPWIDAP